MREFAETPRAGARIEFLEDWPLYGTPGVVVFADCLRTLMVGCPELAQFIAAALADHAPDLPCYVYVHMECGQHAFSGLDFGDVTPAWWRAALDAAKGATR